MEIACCSRALCDPYHFDVSITFLVAIHNYRKLGHNYIMLLFVLDTIIIVHPAEH